MKNLHPALTNYRAIIFDIDDTLIHTFELLVELYAEAARRVGFPDTTADMMRAIWGKPIRVTYPETYPGIDLEEFKRTFFDLLPDVEQRIREGAREILDLLSADGVELGAVTASELYRINMTFDKLDMHHYFPGRVYGSNNLEHTKPDPRSLDPLVNEFTGLGITMDEIAMIGDSIHDYEPARDRGLDFYAVCTGLHTREEFIEAGLDPDRVFDAIADFLV